MKTARSPVLDDRLPIWRARLVLGLLLAGAWDRLGARVGKAVVTAGWALAGWTAAVGSLALWLLLGA